LFTLALLRLFLPGHWLLGDFRPRCPNQNQYPNKTKTPPGAIQKKRRERGKNMPEKACPVMRILVQKAKVKKRGLYGSSAE
jgi:hypothetical protein